MRLLRLDLLRYGHLSDVTLAFPREAALHVVLGANEAGKSTALAAIGDALFGFPHRTPFDFRHDSAQLRIGFEAETRDGTRTTFIRRKGRKDTLLDGAENPVPDAALLPFLGGAGRDLFETAFGLNGRRLREGAEALFRSGGEAGESLLAGMGMPHLRQALARLDAAARELHGDGRGRRLLAVAVEDWATARRAMEDAAVKPRDWADAEAEQRRITAELEQARRLARDLRQEAEQLNRLRRVRPILLALTEKRAELESVADAPTLPPDAAATLGDAAEALRQAGRDTERETAAAERLDAERAALPLDAAILGMQDAIDALAEPRTGAANAARDLPEVRQEMERNRLAVAEAGALLGTADPPETLRERLPAAADRQKAQRLIRDRTELATALRKEQEALRAAQRRRDAAQAAFAVLPAPEAAAPLRRAIAAAREQGQIDGECARAERTLARAAAETAARLGALPLWSDDAAALGACKVPFEAATATAATALAEARRRREVAREAAGALAAEIAALREALRDLERGGVVPTPDAIARERGQRDIAWRAIRRGLEAGTAVEPGLADRFEALRDAADRLADARADDAQQVNEYATKQALLAKLAMREPTLSAAMSAAEGEAAGAEAAWSALWAPAGIVPLDPAAMAEWRRAREDILRLAAAEAEARTRRDDLADRRAAAMAGIQAVRPDLTAPTLAALLDRAEESCAAVEAAEAAHRRLAEAAGKAAEHVAEAEGKCHDAAAALAGFDADWRDAASALGLAQDASVEAVELALGAWASIAEAAKAWRGDAQRVARMERTIADFAAATRAMLARLGEDESEEATLAAARLARRLKQARATAQQDATLADQARARREAAAEAEAHGKAARQRLDALQAMAGAADLPALEDAVRRAALRDALHDSIATLRDGLVAEGDGLDEAALRIEAANHDPDQAAARLAEIAEGQATRDEALKALGRAESDVEARLAAMRIGRDAAGQAQAAQQHLATAQSAAERYARLHLARSLLQAGIERIRQETQGPLLRAAGAHFALLTEGRYSRLSTDEDEGGRTMLRAVRADRSECPVEALSEGARDQLYLALRVATIEAHAAGAEPLPFIADDLLASFDDARATAAIALLAGLGGGVQTILFTHHAHLADLARQRQGVHVQALPGD